MRVITDSKTQDSIHEQVLDRGMKLVAKWSPFLKGIRDPWRRFTTAQLMENTRNWIDGLDESTKMANVGSFEKSVFSLIRAVMPNLVIQNLLSIQPMQTRNGSVFYMDYVFGSTKGSQTKGTKVFDSLSGPLNTSIFSSETIDTETLVASAPAATTTYDVQAQFFPIRPASFTVSANLGSGVAVQGKDDGTGKIVDAATATDGGMDGTNSTIDYDTGAIHLDFATAPATSSAITCSYLWNSEASDLVPQIDILLTSSPIEATRRALIAKWSLEAAQDMRAQYGLLAEAEITTGIAELIRFEIDRELINDLKTTAENNGIGAVSFSRDVEGGGITYSDHVRGIEHVFTIASNKIFSATKKAVGNWIIGGVEVADIVETLPGFVPSAGAQGAIGAHVAGTLNNRWLFVKDPFFTATDFIVGYKGASVFDAAWSYNPYIPLTTTPTDVDVDFQGKKGIMTRYGKKLLNPKFLVKGSITGSPLNVVGIS